MFFCVLKLVHIIKGEGDYMKKATCKDLRGACDFEITGETPEEMAENSKKHVMEMVQTGDKPHQTAIESMMKLSNEDQNKRFEDFVTSFDGLQDA